MSFRRRTGNYLRPVNTLKHVVDRQDGLLVDTPVDQTLVKGVDNPATDAAPEEVTVGSHVKSIYLNVQVAATSTASIANIYMYVYGNPGGTISPTTFPKGNVVGTSDLRKFVFHQEMIMTEKNTTAFPRTLFRGVIKIPRKFNRIGSNDFISLKLYTPGVSYEVCTQCIYKEIR